jgi:subtilisin family serine protease
LWWFGRAGVAPNVTLVPVKVCDTSGNCYASAVVDGITYAGESKLDVINMTFFVDDDSFQQSTRLKCNDDSTQRSFEKAVARAVHYARSQGVTPVAALGNETDDLSSEGSCDEIPAETPGVIGVVSVGPDSAKASYSNWAPGSPTCPRRAGRARPAIARRPCSRPSRATHTGALREHRWLPHVTGLAALIESPAGPARRPPRGAQVFCRSKRLNRQSTLDTTIGG